MAARVYQDGTFTGGSGGYSILNNPATIVGGFVCIAGDVWVRKLATATVIVTGPNTNVTDPEQDPFTAGWLHLRAGASITFGAEAITSNSGPVTLLVPVEQIDIFSDNEGTELLITQH